jgi:hypothetical protein
MRGGFQGPEPDASEALLAALGPYLHDRPPTPCGHRAEKTRLIFWNQL